MKIGIVTFYGTEDNYGQVLQCYAMVRFLAMCGHSAELIKYDRLALEYETQQNPLPLTPKRLIGKSLSLMFKLHSAWQKGKNNRKFQDFYRRHIPSTQVFSIEEIRKNPLSYDLIIAGSDQIWSLEWPFMYVDFASGIKKIAYAVSFGRDDISEEFKARIQGWVADFSHVSVREKSGLNICQKLGVQDAVLMPDPTLLLSKKDYLEICKNVPHRQRKFLLFYRLGNQCDITMKEVRKMARERGLEVVYVTGQGQRDFYTRAYPTIEEWLALYRDAELIVTNSFHGTVFSLIFEKQFRICPLTGPFARMNGRIDTLLEACGLNGSGHNILSTTGEAKQALMEMQEKAISQLKVWMK